MLAIQLAGQGGAEALPGVHPEPYSLALSLQALWASMSPSVKCILMSTCSKATVKTQ